MGKGGPNMSALQGEIAGHCPDAASVPHQANALEVQRVWSRNPDECRSPVCERAAPAIEKAGVRTWTRPRSQSSTQSCIQECSDPSLHEEGPIPGVLSSSRSEGDEAGHGASHSGAEDCHDQLDGVEKRRCVRRQISEVTNSLSVSDPRPFRRWGSSPVVPNRFWDTLGSR